MHKRCFPLIVLLMWASAGAWVRAESSETMPATRPAAVLPGEKIPSELEGIKDFHSLGLLDGRVNIFRQRLAGAGPDQGVRGGGG